MRKSIPPLIVLAFTLLCAALVYQFIYMPHALDVWRSHQPPGEISIYYDGEGHLITSRLIYLASATFGFVSIVVWVLSKIRKAQNS